MRISVIIPCYNSGHLIDSTIESVLRQTVRPMEILCLDDGSTDGTWARLEGIQSRHKDLVRIFRWPENIGNEMRTELIGHARGDWIANLDHDDLWMSTKLEKQIALHKRCPKAEVIHTDGWIQHEELVRARQLQPRPQYRGPSDPHGAIFFANFILASSAIYSKEMFYRIKQPGPYDYPLIGDYELWLRASLNGARFARVPEPLMIRRSYSTGQLGSRLLEHFRDGLRMYKEYEAINRSAPRFKESRGRARVFKAKLDLIVNLLMAPDSEHHHEAAQLWIDLVADPSHELSHHQSMIRLMALARVPSPKVPPSDYHPEYRWKTLNLSPSRKKALFDEWHSALENETARRAIAEETARLFRLGGVSPPFLSIYEREANRIQRYTDDAWSELENQDRRFRLFARG